MKNLKFRYAGAWNFLPFGPDGIEFYFSDYGQVVLITGENKDTGNDRCPASNGVGKSSIEDILSYALYGKTVKRPKKLDHAKVINKITGKKLLVDVQFDDYRIVRGREPNKLNVWHSKDHIWDDTTKITKTADMQAYIEGIIGLSHTAFCNVVVFDDSNSYSFLELDAAGKRQVVENLLGLDRYRAYQESAKSVVKDHKLYIRDISKEVENLQQAIKEADARIAKVNEQQKVWTNNKLSEVATLKTKLTYKQNILSSYDSAKALAEYDAAHQKAADLAISIDQRRVAKEKNVSVQKDTRKLLSETREALSNLESDLQRHRLEYQRLRTVTAEAQTAIARLANLEDGTTCPTCNGKVLKENYAALLKNQQNTMSVSEAGYRKEEQSCKEISEKVEKKKLFIKKIETMIGECEKKETSVDLKIKEETKEMTRLLEAPKPEIGEQERALEVEIVSIKKQIEEKQGEINGISPYKEILEHTETERQEKIDNSEVKKKELDAAEKRLPYLEWWVDAFGDKGIRKHLIEKVIPALNSRVSQPASISDRFLKSNWNLTMN